LLFKVYAGEGPSDSPANFGTFCISKVINKLTFYNIKINPAHRDSIERVLVEKYGVPSSTNEYFKLWQNGDEKLFLLEKREILYVNEAHLKIAIAKMTSGINEAKNKELNLLAKIFISQCAGDLCFYGIGWASKENNFKQLMKKKRYFIRNPESVNFGYFPFGQDNMLDDFNNRANPKFLQNKEVISKWSGFNEDKNMPLEGIKFYFSSRTHKLLYYIVKFKSEYRDNVIEALDSSIGRGKDYFHGKYWEKKNIYIFEYSSNLLYFNKINVSEHVALIEGEGISEGEQQQQKLEKIF
jgi:hypothetical protein